MNEKSSQEYESKEEIEQFAEKSEDKLPERIFLVPYPKIILLYPSCLVAIVAAVWMGITGKVNASPDDSVSVALTVTFLVVLTLNFVVLSFDFPRATSLTLFFFAAALILTGVVLFVFYPDMLPSVTKLIRKVRPVANATFFACITAMMLFLYVIVLISVRFNYWEVRPNELLHHHGFLSDLKRYPAPKLRIDKEINDVFEYLLLRSGRLILHPDTENKAIVLDNVLFIGEKEKDITRMLGALQVKIRPN